MSIKEVIEDLEFLRRAADGPNTQQLAGEAARVLRTLALQYEALCRAARRAVTESSCQELEMLELARELERQGQAPLGRKLDREAVAAWFERMRKAVN